MNMRSKKTITITALFALLAAAIPTVASPFGGKLVSSETILALDTDSYRVTLRGGEKAIVRATACCDDDDIDILIYNASGKLVTKDTLSDSKPYVRWTPAKTETYTIIVDNNEAYDIDYRLTVE